MIYYLQKVENGFLQTDLISSSQRHIFDRTEELRHRGQQHRVLTPQGRVLSFSEIYDMR